MAAPPAPTPTPSITSAAQTFIASYAAAMDLAHATPRAPLPAIAAALAAHYLPCFTSFALGSIASMADAATATAMIQGHLERLVRCGVGCDVRLRGSRVEAAGAGSAVCWVRWGVVPAEGWAGGGGWEWENCYFYRRKGDGTEGWEGVISDGEIAGILERVPGFFGC